MTALLSSRFLKSLKPALLILCLAAAAQLNAQIVLEQEYTTNSNTQEMVFVNLGHNDYKYVRIDYPNDQMDLFNVDHTPFALGVVPPVSFNNAEYQPGYFSRSLFDCDSTTIEYALWNPFELSDFYVFRMDGTLLFQKDSVLAPYCYGCFGASNEKKPIYNTSDGAKLWFMTPQATYLVYDLCGDLPAGIAPLENEHYALKTYPNPAADEIVIECGEFQGASSCEISVFDAKMQLIQTEAIPEDGKVHMNLNAFRSGSYYFVIKSSLGVLRTGKFVVAK